MADITKEYLALRDQYIESRFARLNPVQRQAVFATEGPLLILADYSIAGLASADGRHLAMMPHLERAIFPWQNGCYPADRVNSDQITPWVEAFVNARKWVEANKK